MRRHGFCHLSRHRVGVCVEHVSTTVVGERSDHRATSALNQRRHSLGIHPLHVADPSVVHCRHLTLVAEHNVHISPCESHSVNAKGLQSSHDAFVDKSAVDHSDHLEHSLVGDAASVDHLRFHTEPGSHLRGRASASMHEQFLALHRGEILKKGVERFRIFHNLTAHFYYCQMFFHCLEFLSVNIE